MVIFGGNPNFITLYFSLSSTSHTNIVYVTQLNLVRSLFAQFNREPNQAMTVT